MATKKTTSRNNRANNKSPQKSSDGTSSSNRNSKAATAKKIKAEEDRTTKVIVGLIFIVLGVFLFAAVQFNAAGQFGNIVGNFLKGTLGLIGIIFPFYLILAGILMLLDKTVRFSMYSFVLGGIILIMLCLINSGRFITSPEMIFDAKEFFDKGASLEGGGLFGMGLGLLIVRYLGKVGLYCIGLGVIILCVFLLLKNTPAKRAINALRIKWQEFQLDRAEEKEERIKEKEKQAAQQAIIRDNNEKIRERKLREKEEREKAKENNKSADIAPELKRIKLFPDKDEAQATDIFSDRGQINIQTLDDVNRGQENTYSISSSSEEIQYGIDPPRVSIPGIGLDADYDSRSDGIAIIESQPKPKAPKSTASIEKNTPSKNENNGQNKAAMPDNDAKKPEKLTKTEAENATLSDSDFNKTKKPVRYKKPSIELLKHIPNSTDKTKLNSELQEKAQLLEDTLKSFNVDAKVVKVTQGPTVTRYEIQPNAGVKVNKIVNLADDIALNLRAKSIRIEAPIPGKAAVGIEVENDNVNMVTIRELIDSREFKQAESKISFGVGRDIAGNAIVANLKEMPHLLIAGSTGSGKSVCINGIITSILYKADPDEVKLVLIDPKVVELGDYNGIPHLLIPVVTEPTKAAAALNWAVAEMNDRYKKFADSHVRDLEGYNEYLRANGNGDEVLPQIVIIIDELADLMMAAPHQVEESICRIAQLARAAGMHLIVATQRPSVDVITGLIKANVPSRIAFAVASQFDSRTILDMSGAEKLVGKGDMLYSPLGMSKPMRVQGCFISDEEIHRVIDFVKNQRDADYSDEVLETINRGNLQDSSNDTDELFDEAVTFVISADKASTSLIQRRFRIGYNRAANIIDEMELRGIIGPAEGSKPRQVLISTWPPESGAQPEEDISDPDTVIEPEQEQEVEAVSDADVEYTSDTEEPREGFEHRSLSEIEEEEPELNKDIQDLFDALDSK